MLWIFYTSVLLLINGAERIVLFCMGIKVYNKAISNGILLEKKKFLYTLPLH